MRDPLAALPRDLRQEQEADYRVFDLRGDHYTIGYEMGRATAFRPVPSWRDADEERAFARACAEVVCRFHPPLLDEFRGYAEAQDRPWEDLLPHFSNNLPEGALGGCTTFVRRLTDGRVLVGRNHDYLYTRKERYLRRLSPVGYPASLGTQSGYVGSCYDGVNSRGLFVALHTIRANRAERVPPGIPAYLIPRILLETCATARQAVGQIRRMSFLHPFNYVIADQADMFVAETYPGRLSVRRADGDSLVVANYYAAPDMRPLHGRRDLSEYEDRARWIMDRIAADAAAGAGREGEDGWRWAQAILRDHTTPVCCHRPNQATFWSLVADLSARRIAYSLGAPCRNPFREWEWPRADI